MTIVKEILDVDMWNEWVESRPEVVKQMCIKYPPDRLYRFKDSGRRGTIHSYNEAGTVTVNVTGEYNFVSFDTGVFGVDPENLEECDLPPEGERLGRFCNTQEEIDEYIKGLKKWVAEKKAAEDFEELYGNGETSDE